MSIFSENTYINKQITKQNIYLYIFIGMKKNIYIKIAKILIYFHKIKWVDNLKYSNRGDSFHLMYLCF